MLLITLLLGLLAIALPRLLTALHARTRLYSLADTPAQPLAIVFGAGLRRDGSPTAVLRDRVATAADLYFAGKVRKLLMSGTGENPFSSYNEPAAMREYALQLGVPAEDIVLDEAGRRTYDTCYRARHVFDLESAVLVTQGFHLPRALYTCNALGLSAVGVPAEGRAYRPRSLFFWNLREVAATLVAMWEVHVSQPQPATTGDPQPIFPREAQ